MVESSSRVTVTSTTTTTTIMTDNPIGGIADTIQSQAVQAFSETSLHPAGESTFRSEFGITAAVEKLIPTVDFSVQR